MKKVLILCLALFSSVIFANDDEKYLMKNSYTVEKPEVVEFFYYGCPHCLHMNNKMMYWKNNNKDVVYKKVPIVFNDQMKLAAKHFFTAEILNIEEDFSYQYYKEIASGKYITDDLAISIMTKFVDKGIVLKNLNSNIVKQKIKEADSLAKKHSILVFPTYIVNGKYKINASMTGGYDNLLVEIDRLLNK